MGYVVDQRTAQGHWKPLGEYEGSSPEAAIDAAAKAVKPSEDVQEFRAVAARNITTRKGKLQTQTRFVFADDEAPVAPTPEPPEPPTEPEPGAEGTTQIVDAREDEQPGQTDDLGNPL